MRLRPYQDKCVESIFENLQQVDSTLAVLPTGCGKTVIFSEFCRRWTDRRVLVVAHREELIDQAADKIEQSVGERPEIEMGEFWASRESILSKPHVVVTSVQTMSRPGRQKGFHPEDFGAIVIDEAHHAVAKSYRKVIDYFAGAKILGVTATPDRSDEEALGRIFQSVAFEYQILDAIQDGWLVPIQQEMIDVEGLDLSQVRTTAGDLNAGQLEKIMLEEESLHKVAAPTVELAGDKSTLIFTAGVAHAHALAEIISRHGKTAVALDGTTDSEERRDTIKRFKQGDIQFLCNCGLFLEGFDAPNTAIVVMARPTKSRSLYCQMLGRGTRTLPGTVDGYDDVTVRRLMIEESDKPHMTVLDFTGNSGRHKLISAADILGGNYSEEVIEAAKEAAKQSGKPKDVLKQLEDEDARLKREMEEKLLAEQRRYDRQKLAAKAIYSRIKMDPFNLLDIAPAREPGWHKGRPMTQNQRGALLRIGFDEAQLADVGLCKAGQLIDEAKKRRSKGLCSVKQAKLLAKFGERTDMMFDEARQVIDEIAQGGWKPRERRNSDASHQKSRSLSST